MTPIQRFAAWLAAVTLVPPGRPHDGFEPDRPTRKAWPTRAGGSCTRRWTTPARRGGRIRWRGGWWGW